MTRRPFFYTRGPLWAYMWPVLLVPILLFTGCAWYMKWFEEKVPLYVINPRFSLNVAYVNDAWPSDPLKLPLVQQEVLRTLGTPEAVHLWWDRIRPISTRAEVHQYKTAGRAEFVPLKESWIYLDRKKEVLFKKDDQYEVIPLSDKLQIICEVGDPDDVKQFVSGGKRSENWIYYHYGRIYKFSEDNLIGMDNVAAVPNYGRF